MADKLPAMPWYVGDWLKDTSVAMCALPTRAVWFELLNYMWTDDRCGQVTGTIAQLAKLARCSDAEMSAAVADLSDTRTANVVTCHEKITIVNRRMRRDYESRLEAAERQRRSREKRQGRTDQKPAGHKNVTAPLSSSCSHSVSDSSLEASASCSEPPPATAEPPIFEFPTVGKSPKWGLTQAVVETLQDGFPDLDILAECRKAKAWCESNPSKRKTPGGMRKFLFGWMERSQNRGGQSKGSGLFDQTDPRGTAATVNSYLQMGAK